MLRLAFVFSAVSIALVYGRAVTLWTELGIDVDTKLPPLNALSPLSATGGACDNGTRQSPIDIPACSTAMMNPLRLKGHGLARPEGFTMINTGSTAQISFNGAAPTLSGGPLSAEYTLLQMHFHWGEQDSQGSEHATGGQYGALEAHFVHFKSEYGNVSAAITHEDGLAVYGIIFTLASADNPKLEGMLSKLASITNKADTVTLAADAMNWVNDVISYFKYYTYPGSLTTSPCSEVVTWLVSQIKLPVSAAQVDRFRQMMGTEGKLLEYRREVQDLKGRSPTCSSGCVLK